MTRENRPNLDDDQNPEWTEEDVRTAIRFEDLPESVRTKLSGRKRGPQAAPTKERITIRLSSEVVNQFRSTGGGWQTRIDAALMDWLKHHPFE